LKIFIDYGFGYLKAQDETGKQVIFPSLAGELQQGSFEFLPSQAIGITTNDGSWMFGESAAQQSAFASHVQSNDWVLSPRYKAGILAAISELTRASRVEVELMLGLPYTDIKPFKKELLKNLVGEHNIKRLGRDRQQITIIFPTEFSVMPQSILPIFVHILNPHGGFNFPQTKRSKVHYGVANIGSHTVECGTMTLTFPLNFDIIHTQCRTEPKGMYSLSSVIRPILIEKLAGRKSKFTDHEIFESVKTSICPIANQDVNVSDFIVNAKRDYCEDIQNICSSNWADTSPIPKSDLFGFVVSGGGAHVVEPYLKVNAYHPNILVSDNPQLDVIEGMKRLRKMLERI
jgi:hypothetical protein